MSDSIARLNIPAYRLTDSPGMTVHPILSQLALGYQPMIDRHRLITAVQLTVFPSPPGAALQADELLALLADSWPADTGRLVLNIADEGLLTQLMSARLPPPLQLEVPAFMVIDPQHAAALKALHASGATLLVKGRPLAPLAPELLPCFNSAIIDLADERRDGLPPPGGVARHIPHVQSGVASVAEMTDAFSRGAVAVLGWPFEPAPPPKATGRAVKAGIAAVVELINRVDRQAPVDQLEAVIKNEPTLAYKLLRYINSPVFGLRMEINSFGQAIMLLGYQRLKRWLALLLVSGSGDPALRPLAFAAVRRGLLMEGLGRDSGIDPDQCSELFVCGVFSLLDRMLQQPFAQLLASIPTSAAVSDALQFQRGPFQAYLSLVQAIEASSLFDIRDATDALMLEPATVNAAVLRSLADARQLD